jgi:hypothetical protein
VEHWFSLFPAFDIPTGRTDNVHGACEDVDGSHQMSNPDSVASKAAKINRTSHPEQRALCAKQRGCTLCQATLVDLCYSCNNPLEVECPFTRTGSPASGQLFTPLLPAHVVGLTLMSCGSIATGHSGYPHHGGQALGTLAICTRLSQP